MTGLAPHLIIDALSILAIAIDKESPRSAACTQELVVLFSIYFFLGSYLYYCCFAIFRVFLLISLAQFHNSLLVPRPSTLKNKKKGFKKITAKIQ